MNLATRVSGFAIVAVSLCVKAADAQSLLFPVGEGPFDWPGYEAFAEAHDFSGQVLTITGADTGAEADVLRNVFGYFAAATGAEVRYSGSESFEQDIVIATEAGSPPDIAYFPQPGLAADIAARGHLVPLTDGTETWVRENYAAGSSWAELGMIANPGSDETDLYGFFFDTSVKSLVWYVPENFEESGYEVPETLEALTTLTKRIAADGETPWCIGLGSGAATGWPGTDWVEDLILRTQSPEVYDQWVNHEIPFDDPWVVAAIELYGAFVRGDGHTPLGPEGAAATDFRDSPRGLFTIPSECFMHRQASFIANFFPDGVEVGEDVDFFYLPASADGDLGRPVLGSGSMVTLLDDRPVVHAFIDFLKLPVAHEVAMTQGKFLSAHLGANEDAYATQLQKDLSGLLRGATTFRFDASDLMPGEIGTGAFWTAMVDYTTRGDATAAAAEVEARWRAID